MFTLLASLLLVGPAHAAELTVEQAVAAGLGKVAPSAVPKGSEDCACVVIDYGDKGSLKLTTDQVTSLQRVTGSDPGLYASVGEHKFRLAGGLCERVALVSMSVAQWLHEELAVVDSSGQPSSGGCNVVPTR